MEETRKVSELIIKDDRSIKDGLTFEELVLKLQEQLDRIPDEIACEIISFVTKWKDIQKLDIAARNNERLKSLVSSCIAKIDSDKPTVLLVDYISDLKNLRYLGDNVLIGTYNDLFSLNCFYFWRHIRGTFTVYPFESFDIIAYVMAVSYYNTRHKERVIIGDQHFIGGKGVWDYYKDVGEFKKGYTEIGIAFNLTKYRYVILQGNYLFIHSPYIRYVGFDLPLQIQRLFPDVIVRAIINEDNVEYNPPTELEPEKIYLMEDSSELLLYKDKKPFIARPSFMKFFSKVDLGKYSSYSGFRTGIFNVPPMEIVGLYIATNLFSFDDRKIKPNLAFNELYNELHTVVGKEPEISALDALHNLNFDDGYEEYIDSVYLMLDVMLPDETTEDLDYLYARELNQMEMPTIPTEKEFNDDILKQWIEEVRELLD